MPYSMDELLKKLSQTEEPDSSIEADENQAMEDAQLKQPVPDLINQAADEMIGQEAARKPASRDMSEHKTFDEKLTPALPESKPQAPAPAPEQSPLEQYSDLLKRAQQARRRDLAGADIFQGGSTIAQGFARGYGANIGDQSDFANNMRKNAELPITELGEQTKGRMDDPNSDISKYMRGQAVAIMKKLNPEFDAKGLERMSANELQKLPGLSSVFRQNQPQLRFERRLNPQTGVIETVALDTRTGQEVRTIGQTGFAQQFREDPQSKELVSLNPSQQNQTPISITGPGKGAIAQAEKTAPKEKGIEINKGLLNTRQIEQVDKARNDFITEAKDDIGALQAAQGVTRVLNGPKEGKISQDIIRAIQNQLARASGERGAMTEGDVTGFGGRGALMDRLERMVQVQATGLLPEEDRKLLKGLAGIMEKRAQDFVKQRSNFYTENIYNDLSSNPSFKGKKINRDSVSNLLGSQIYTNPMKQESSDTVKIKGPSGQVVTMTKENAQKYLSKPGYEQVK